MNSENGYYYLNLANQWPSFLLTSTLEIAPDGAIKLRRLADGSFELRGVIRGGPFAAGDMPTLWYRLQAFADTLAPGAHLQLFTFTGESNPPYDPNAENPFANS